MQKLILQKKTDTTTQYEKLKVESFKENILQNLRYNIKEIFDSEITIVKSKCEELVQKSSVRFNKQIDQKKTNKNELKTNNKKIDQLFFKSLSNLTNSDLESKCNIHKLLDQTNDEEKKKSIQCQNEINTKSDIIRITNLMKRIVSIVPRKLKNTLKETKQIICQIALNPWMRNQKQIREKRYVLKYWVILC